MTPQPEPPENVRVVVAGREIPVECVFVGRDPLCGCALWVTTIPIYIGTELDIRLRVDYLPARTDIGIEMVGDPL